METSRKHREEKRKRKHTSPDLTLIHHLFGRYGIKRQLYFIYLLALFVPVTMLGIFLIMNTANLLKNYYSDMVASDNLRLKAIFFEITTQMYNMSENICNDEHLARMLGAEYSSERVFMADADAFINGNGYIYNYAEVEELTIYTDNPSVSDHRIFRRAGDAGETPEWFLQAAERSSVLWMPLKRTDKYGNIYWNLCLVRRIPQRNDGYHAVLVIKISDNYLRTRVESSDYETIISADNGQIVYASDRTLYGEPMHLEIDYDDAHFSYADDMMLDGGRSIVNISTLNMYQSESRIYICTLNRHAYDDIHRITRTCFLIVLTAILLPGIMIFVFTRYFTTRVELLREEMHKASHGDYNITADFRGRDELSEAFADLQVMVEKIQEKEAAMYQSQIGEKELMNKQQEMEFKMLASQINPHFLYNTLETIRMNAFAAGDREVANAIKLLGKSLRYVLENTGTASTTLQKEMDYIENYIKIQKFRFGSRIDYQLIVDDDICLKDYQILPLLLQPIVENAILHGLEEKENGGLVTVHIYLDQNLHIDISDNGCGMELEQVRKLRNSISVRNPEIKASIGLYNINQRIKLCYGSRYGMSISSVPGKGTMISLVIPAMTDSAM
ncbi:MAG: sensor histidine kinase [Clostridium sp.]|nr:sensor histidine kinase [Clostridium sp.]